MVSSTQPGSLWLTNYEHATGSTESHLPNLCVFPCYVSFKAWLTHFVLWNLNRFLQQKIILSPEDSLLPLDSLSIRQWSAQQEGPQTQCFPHVVNINDDTDELLKQAFWFFFPFPFPHLNSLAIKSTGGKIYEKPTYATGKEEWEQEWVCKHQLITHTYF